MENQSLVPHLIVSGAERAIDFYVQVFGARERDRYVDAGRVVHAALVFAGTTFTLSEEHREWHNLAPSSIGGSAVVLRLTVDDPDATAARAVERGAKIVFPVADQYYGRREGRIQDPFGHLWIVSRLIEELSPDETRRRMNALSST
jgi:PhnB protein